MREEKKSSGDEDATFIVCAIGAPYQPGADGGPLDRGEIELMGDVGGGLGRGKIGGKLERRFGGEGGGCGGWEGGGGGKENQDGSQLASTNSRDGKRGD